MRALDRVLQLWRMRVASPHVPDGSRVLDIGCHQGEFFKLNGRRLGPSVGIDPLASSGRRPGYVTLPLQFSEPLPFASGAFDAVVMLATLEHIPDTDSVARECSRLLPNGGRVVLTVPSTMVDGLVNVLIRARLASGMSLEQHFGLDPSIVPGKFLNHGFAYALHRRFQLGLNHLMVFRKP